MTDLEVNKLSMAVVGFFSMVASQKVVQSSSEGVGVVFSGPKLCGPDLCDHFHVIYIL